MILYRRERKIGNKGKASKKVRKLIMATLVVMTKTNDISSTRKR
jgi:hypothetical protein